MSETNELAIFRFAHAFASGAGTETYLEDLDKTLLNRNAWTIFRVYLTTDDPPGEKREESFEQGKLIRIPVHVEKRENNETRPERVRMERWIERVKLQVRDKILFNPFLYRMVFHGLVERIPTARRELEALGVRDVFKDVLKLNRIDLLVMHHLGGRDGAELVEESVSNGIPYVFVNHYSNDVLNHLSVRKQIAKASGIGGVSNVGVPRQFRHKFFNLSDGIDTEIFKIRKQRKETLRDDFPVVLLPARVTPSKGQRDLIEACNILKREGIRMFAVMAGRIESLSYFKELKQMALRNAVHKNVLFLGELSTRQLREWFEIAEVLAFPTYHNEGLGRVLIESQAMHTPPISYIIGGTPEAIINGETGYLVDKGDVNEFAAKLKDLLVDIKLRRKMSIAGRRFVENRFSLGALAERHEKFYLKAAKFFENTDST
mgnify:CR=1 FL=1